MRGRRVGAYQKGDSVILTMHDDDDDLQKYGSIASGTGGVIGANGWKNA